MRNVSSFLRCAQKRRMPPNYCVEQTRQTALLTQNVMPLRVIKGGSMERIHTILWLGRLSLNFQRLHEQKDNFTILRVEGKGTFPVDVPSEKVDGIVFGYMQEGDKFFAVKVENIALTTPVRLVPRLHTDNKGFGPMASQFGDKSAKRLLNDIIVKNLEQEVELMVVYNKYFDTDFGFSLPEEITETEALYEGTKRQISVNAYERNPEARRKCITHYGTSCVICGFNFAKRYGEVGKNLIHVHHLRELSDIGEKYEIDPIQDLRPVCPNCHAIIHRHKPAYSIKEVKNFLRRAAKSI